MLGVRALAGYGSRVAKCFSWQLGHGGCAFLGIMELHLGGPWQRRTTGQPRMEDSEKQNQPVLFIGLIEDLSEFEALVRQDTEESAGIEYQAPVSYKTL